MNTPCAVAKDPTLALPEPPSILGAYGYRKGYKQQYQNPWLTIQAHKQYEVRINFKKPRT